jgi:hypothetical protein
MCFLHPFWKRTKTHELDGRHGKNVAQDECSKSLRSSKLGTLLRGDYCGKRLWETLPTKLKSVTEARAVEKHPGFAALAGISVERWRPCAGSALSKASDQDSGHLLQGYGDRIAHGEFAGLKSPDRFLRRIDPVSSFPIKSRSGASA